MVSIALIFPNFNLYETFSLLSHQHSLSLGYLATSLEKENISYEIIDAAAEKLNHRQIIERIKKYEPEFIGITTNITLAYSAIILSNIIRKFFPKIRIIMGGPWANGTYETILKNGNADCIVLGEGEYTLPELLKTPWKPDNLNKIKGIVFKEGIKIK